MGIHPEDDHTAIEDRMDSLVIQVVADEELDVLVLLHITIDRSNAWLEQCDPIKGHFM